MPVYQLDDNRDVRFGCMRLQLSSRSWVLTRQTNVLPAFILSGLLTRRQAVEAPATTPPQISAPAHAGPLRVHTQHSPHTISVAHAGRVETQSNNTAQTTLHNRRLPTDPAKVVWQSLGLPYFRSSKVQDLLEYWHVEASVHLLDSYHLQELLRSYITALEWASPLFLRIYSSTSGMGKEPTVELSMAAAAVT